MLSYSWGMTSNKCGCEAQTPSLVPPIEASPPLIYSHFGRRSGKVRRPCHNWAAKWQGQETLPQLGGEVARSGDLATTGRHTRHGRGGASSPSPSGSGGNPACG